MSIHDSGSVRQAFSQKPALDGTLAELFVNTRKAQIYHSFQQELSLHDLTDETQMLIMDMIHEAYILALHDSRLRLGEVLL